MATRTRRIENDGVDIHLGGGLLKRWTDKLPGALMKLVGPAIGAALTAGGGVAWQKMHDAPPPAAAAYPLVSHGYEGGGRVSALESQVSELKGDVKAIKEQTGSTNIAVANMDGKLDGILKAMKAMQAEQ